MRRLWCKGLRGLLVQMEKEGLLVRKEKRVRWVAQGRRGRQGLSAPATMFAQRQRSSLCQ